MFSQASLIISKQRNKLSKDTFEAIISLKSQGIYLKENEKENKLKEAIQARVSKDNSYIYIPSIELED